MVGDVSTDDAFVEVLFWRVDVASEGARLDHFLRDQDTDHTRSKLKKLIETGCVSVDGNPSRPAQKLRTGQEVVLRVPPPEPLTVIPEDIPLDIRFEDDFVVVVNKQQGLVVHPAPGHSSGTLVNGLLFGRDTAGGDSLRPGIVHRLDKDTSGLMVVAKTEKAHATLAYQFHEHSVDRRYVVLVSGEPPDRGEWDTLHGRHPRDRRRFSSKVHRGKRALSRFETVERFKGASLLRVTLFTGRTHQVRVHCHDHGFSVLGDPWYHPRHMSTELTKIHRDLPGQALHAELLGFDHPETAKRLRFEAVPPNPFQQALEALRSL